jgi:hypothetical protein
MPPRRRHYLCEYIHFKLTLNFTDTHIQGMKLLFCCFKGPLSRKFVENMLEEGKSLEIEKY